MIIERKEELIKFLESRNEKEIESFIIKYGPLIGLMDVSDEKINNIQTNGKSLYVVNNGIINCEDLNPRILIRELKYTIDDEYINIVHGNGIHFIIKTNENDLIEKLSKRYSGDKVFNNYDEALLYIKNKIEKRIEFLTKSLDYYGKKDIS